LSARPSTEAHNALYARYSGLKSKFMTKAPILSAIEQICQEKKLSKEQVLDALEQALAAAYRKDFGEKNQNIKVKFDPDTCGMKVWDEKTVALDLPPEEELPPEGKKKKVKEEAKEDVSSDLSAVALAKAEALSEAKEEEKRRFNPKTEIQLQDAKKINKKYKVGDVIIQDLEIPAEFGRIAAQTAKQVVIQRLREAERETIFKKYEMLVGKVIPGIVQRKEIHIILIDLVDATAILPQSEQILEEKYWPGQKIKVYLSLVTKTPKGPEIIVSRRHPDIVKELFTSEIPEIANGTVVIKAITREAGLRSKIAVTTKERGIDPIGSCIGQRGIRIQTIISELGGEKVDIIEYSEDPEEFITNALAPAKIVSLKINEKEKVALAAVKKNQLSLAIGKRGQNVRLASKLTGWKIDVKEAREPAAPEKKKEAEEKPGKKEPEKKKIKNKKPKIKNTNEKP